MNEGNGTMREHFENELNEASQGLLLSGEERKKKLIIYIIRTSIAVVIYYLLWKYYWVRMSLWLYIPLNLMGLLTITLMPMILQRKYDKTKALIEKFPGPKSQEEE